VSAPSSDPYARQVPSHEWDAHTTVRIAALQEGRRKIRPIGALNMSRCGSTDRPIRLIVGSGKLGRHRTTGQRVFRMGEQQPKVGRP